MDNSSLEEKMDVRYWLKLASVDTKKTLLNATFILINLYLIFCDPRSFFTLRCSLKIKKQSSAIVFGLQDHEQRKVFTKKLLRNRISHFCLNSVSADNLWNENFQGGNMKATYYINS